MMNKGSSSLEELLKYTADFKKYLQLDYQPAGWYRDDEK
jgi:hypothetical protein